MKTLGSSVRLAVSVAGLSIVALAQAAGADTNVSGTISTSTTWTLANSPYVLTGDVYVEGSSTPILTIQAGVTVKFNQNRTLFVGYNNLGGLQAVGTGASPITFTANTGSPTPGYFRLLLYPNTRTTQISYATVGYGGGSSSGGIYIQGCSPTISNVTVTNSAYAGININGGSPSISSSTITSNPVGIYTSNGATPSLASLTISNNTGFAISQDCSQTMGAVSGLTLTGNGTNGVELRSGTVAVTTTWKSGGSPYVVTGDVYVEGGSTPVLTIEAGVTVKFNQNRTLFIGNNNLGGLQAVGTSVAPITFTANGSTSPGYFRLLLYPNTRSTQISYATVSYGGGSGSGGIYIQGSSPTISNVTVTNSAYAGININGGSPSISSSTITSNPVGIYTSNGATPSLTSLTISNNTGFAISQDCGQTLGAVSGLTLTGNGTNGVEVRSGTVAVNTTWKSGGSPYVMTGDIYVEGGSTPVLTIEAGVTVKFNQNRTLFVGNSNLGALQAVGTSGAPITFTANGSTSPGYFRLLLNPHTVSTQISYATVSYGGGSSSGGIYVQGCSPTISNVTVTNSAYAGININGGSPSISSSTITSNPVGIYTSSGATPSLTSLTISNNTGFAISQDCSQTLGAVSGLTLTGNGTNGVELRSGTVAVNTTWKSGGSPYVMTGDIYVEGGSTPVLTIEAGVTVKFNQNRTLFVGYGNPAELLAVGTSVAPITFTANGSTSPGYFRFMLYSKAASSQISYATVSYGGGSSSGGIYVQGCSPTISNVTVTNNAYAGISVSSGSPSIVSSTFASNPAGIINATPNVPVNALLNYWGSSTGPSGIGPGTGQSVSAGVQFNPWLTATPTAPEYFSSGTDSNLRFNPSTSQAAWSVSASQSSNWTLAVSNSSHNVVRTITGSGTTFSPTWNGRNDQGVLQPDGIYSYSLQAGSQGGTAGPATGNLSVDSLLNLVLTSPTNGQTVSNVYTNGATTMPVTGTASMTSLVGWELNYGAGAAPGTWTTVGSGTQSVINGTFATWSFLIPNQLYTLLLLGWDGAGYYSQVSIGVTVGNFSASENALQLSAPASNTVTYTSAVPFTLTETVTIKNGAGQIVRTLVNGVPRSANTYNDVWDGKSDSAGFVPDGPYFYFATVTDGTHSLTWDQTSQYYNDWSAQQNPSLQAWDPFNNRPQTLSYNFAQPGRVNIALRPADGGGCATPGFCLEQNKYEESGPHTIAWAGVDSTGAFRPDIAWAEQESSRATFSKNAIVLFGTKPSVTNVTVTPAMYGPAVGTQTVAFDLATFQNQAATVTVTFLNQASLSILRTITLTGQSPGHKTVPWDGHADNGMWVTDGPYTVTVSATDPIGNQVQGQILTTIRY